MRNYGFQVSSYREDKLFSLLFFENCIDGAMIAILVTRMRCNHVWREIISLRIIMIGESWPIFDPR